MRGYYINDNYATSICEKRDKCFCYIDLVGFIIFTIFAGGFNIIIKRD